jgi:hypothetical protein
MPTIDLGANEYPVFSDVAAADIYLAGDVLRAGPWGLRNDDAKKRGLISATRMLAPLPWVEPQDPAAAEANETIAQVCAMLASDLLAKPKLFADASGASNVKVARAGSASVEFFWPVEGGPPIPKAMWDMLVAAGLVVGGEDLGDGSLEGPFVGTPPACRPLGGRRLIDCAEDCD